MHYKIIIGIVALVIIAMAVIWYTSSTDNATHPPNRSENSVTYLPLGDSYTIGQSVTEAERWPNQLVRTYADNGRNLEIVANPAVTGYTSQDLIDRELPLVEQLKPDFVSVQIGVNDYVQGVDEQAFAANLGLIVTSIKAEISNPKNIILVTIPDFGKTPAGARFGNPTEAETSIRKFNDIIFATGKRHDIVVADIFPVSHRVVQDPQLTADDGLHPSGAQYALWTEIIYGELRQRGLPE